MYNGKILNKDKMFKLKTNAKFPDITLANLQAKESVPTKEKQIIIADVPFDGLSSVTVEAIPDEYIIPSGTKEIIENGIYDVTENANIDVNVPEPETITKKVDSNGTYRAIDDNAYGYSEVEVSVPSPKVISKNVVENGTYNAQDDDAFGYNQVIVDVPKPELSIKTITENGTYKAEEEGIYGYSQIEVNVPTGAVVSPDYVSFYQYPGTTLDLSWLRTDKINNTSYMFSKVKNTAALDISKFDTSSVTDMTHMFEETGKNGLFVNIDLSNLETNNVTSMTNMFASCYIDNIDLSSWNTSKVTNMASMFQNARFKTINLSNIDTSKVTTMGYMFYSNTMQNLDLSHFDVSNVTQMNSMFFNCTALKSLNIQGWNTSKVNTFYSTFQNCYALEELPELNCSSISTLTNAFTGCGKLINLGGFENLGQAYLTTTAANYNNYTLNLSPCSQLTHDSLMNVINNLYDIATKGCNAQKLQLGSTNLAKLTEEEIQIAQNKGWTVS